MHSRFTKFIAALAVLSLFAGCTKAPAGETVTEDTTQEIVSAEPETTTAETTTAETTTTFTTLWLSVHFCLWGI